MKIDIGKILMSVIMVIMFVLILAVSGALSGCEPKQGPPLETECKYNTPISLMVVEYDTQAEMNKAWEFYNRQKLPEKANAEGFATYNRAVQIHTLHVLKIRGQADSRRIETLGHELMHSFCGDWHPRTVG